MSLGEALDELDKKNDLLVDAQFELAQVLDFATGQSDECDVKSAVAAVRSYRRPLGWLPSLI